MGKLARIAAAILGVAVAMLGLALGGTAIAAETDNAPNPTFWPDSPTINPRLVGYANAIRFSGADRYSTSLALALGLRGQGSFPFGSPNRHSSGATKLGQTSHWWGAATCPRSIIVVAGDNPADALAASALSDPTGQSSEPYLQRSAAADPLFDPIGGFARVDTDNAPIIVTASARQGASLLSPAANLAVRDLVNGGCNHVWQAIVVGGPAAVAITVEAELVSLGIPEVFRVSGANRFATAAAITKSLGTAAVPAGVSECDSPTATTAHTAMGFYANSVVEYRSSATECEVLGRTVVLADGMVGADALAAGWWTSFWQTPILLHDGSTVLPQATADTFETTDVDTIVALGGTARLPEAVLNEAVALTGANVIRVAGVDRYETSIAMAKHFGGWWPTAAANNDDDSEANDDTSFANSIVCFAASSGAGATAKGWPDALGAGPLCGSLNGAVLAANPNGAGAPSRALAPTNGLAPTQSPPPGGTNAAPGHQAVPIILVNTPDGGDQLPASAAEFLAEVFAPVVSWCSAAAFDPDCVTPGFGVLVGGEAVIEASAAQQMSWLIGGSGADVEPAQALVGNNPYLEGGFYTGLNLAPVFDVASSPTPNPTLSRPGWVCVPRDAYRDIRWLGLYNTGTYHTAQHYIDVVTSNRYVTDADGAQRQGGVAAPICLALSDSPDEGFEVLGVSSVGRVTPAASWLAVNPQPENLYQLDSPIELSGPTSASGHDSSATSPAGATTTFTFTAASPLTQNPAPTVTSRGDTEAVTETSISLTLTRGETPQVSPGMPTPPPAVAPTHTFSGSWSITTAAGVITGTVEGEAIRAGSQWQLRGEATAVGGTWNVALGHGGFSADIATGIAGTFSDDAISWLIDGLANG